MIGKKIFLCFADAFLAALIITIIAATGWLEDIDNRFSDYLYQNEGTKSSEIVVIGIDAESLNRLGNISAVSRRNFAKAINNLNSNPTARPAVIGIDGVFETENSEDTEGDKELIKAFAQYKNVVTGSEADFDDENVSVNDKGEKIWHWTGSFPKLAEVTDTGHINAAIESDGVTRHCLLYVNTLERDKVYSFARVIYEKYCDYKNTEKNIPPDNLPDGIFYLPFTAKSYSADYNFADLVEGNTDCSIYKDKIVLIGPYAPGMQDSTPTSLDRSDLMYGVDVHANAIETFQKNFLPSEFNQNVQLAILFIVCFIAELIFRNNSMKILLITWLAICISWIVICKICYQNEIVLHALWIPSSVSILFTGAISTNYIYKEFEKNQVTKTFGRYVDPVIMNKILTGDSKYSDLGGELHNIAVLFVDIRGFTAMSEKLPATDVVEILNSYLTLTAECIRKNHGTLDKFVGDCTMAFWNSPVPQKNAVYLACHAAMDMLEGSKTLDDEIMRKYNHKISFGIGINWGSAVVGNIGTSFRMDYTAIGDTVNTAARLESNAKGGTILISRAVKDILGDYADTTSLGNTIKLKGKSQDFEIFVLNSLKEMEDTD